MGKKPSPAQNSSAFDQRYARSLAKKRLFHLNYGTGPTTFAKNLKTRAEAKSEDIYKRYEEDMKQKWIIQDEWSEYHAMVASQMGFALVCNKGLWEIHTVDTTKVPTNEDARNHVVAHEHDGATAIYGFAIQAIIMGSMRGK